MTNIYFILIGCLVVIALFKIVDRLEQTERKLK